MDDLEIQRKIHFKVIDLEATLDGTEVPGEWCNCGLLWPCAVLEVYVVAATPEGAAELRLRNAMNSHHWDWKDSGASHVHQYCSECRIPKPSSEHENLILACPGKFPSGPSTPIASMDLSDVAFGRSPISWTSEPMEPLRLPAIEAVFIWRCGCGGLNDLAKGGEQFCKHCRTQNPVADNVYTIQGARHWPPDIRKARG